MRLAAALLLCTSSASLALFAREAVQASPAAIELPLTLTKQGTRRVEIDGDESSTWIKLIDALGTKRSLELRVENVGADTPVPSIALFDARGNVAATLTVGESQGGWQAIARIGDPAAPRVLLIAGESVPTKIWLVDDVAEGEKRAQYGAEGVESFSGK